MSTTTDTHQLEMQLLGAALRYCAVADWFEGLPVRRRHVGDEQAMELFNGVESELRAAGEKLLRRHGHRALVLQAAGISPCEGVAPL